MHLQGWLHSVSGHCFNLVFVTLPEPPPPLHTSGSDFVSRQCLPAAFQRFSCTCLRITRLPLNLLKILLVLKGTSTTLRFTTHIVGYVSFSVWGDVDLGLIYPWKFKKHSHYRHVGPSRQGAVSLPKTTFYVLLKLIERCPSHRPSMLHLQLYCCWCKHKAHL